MTRPYGPKSCPLCGGAVYRYDHEPTEGVIEDWVECESTDCKYSAMAFDHDREFYYPASEPEGKQ